MFGLSMNFDLTDIISARIKTVESREITIGIKNENAPSAVAKSKYDGYRTLKNDSSGTRVRKVEKMDTSYTLQKQLLDLEDYELFSGALDDVQNQDLLIIFEALENIFLNNKWDVDDENILLNASRALIRNRIIERRLGVNSEETVEEKGFDKPMMDTGTLFTAIEAWYSKT